MHWGGAGRADLVEFEEGEIEKASDDGRQLLVKVRHSLDAAAAIVDGTCQLRAMEESEQAEYGD